jgi:hypothetical protein
LDFATRCSTLASVGGSGSLQKKHFPPWANSKRSKGLIGMMSISGEVYEANRSKSRCIKHG